MTLKLEVKKTFLKLFICITFIIGLVYSFQSANATELPPSIVEYIKNTYPGANIRFDGLIELPDGNVYLPILPTSYTEHEGSARISMTIPENSDRPDLIIFANNLTLMRIIQNEKGEKTLISGHKVPIKVKLGLMPQDLVIPEGLIVPPDMSSVLGDLVIPTKLMESPTLKSTNSPVENNQILQADNDVPIITNNNIEANNKTEANNTTISLKPLVPINDVNSLDRLPGLKTEREFSFGNKLLYVVGITGNKIYLVDPQLAKIINAIQVAPLPYSAVLGLDGKHLYVICMASNSVASVNTYTQQLENIIKVGLRPTGLAISPDGTRLFVANSGSGTVSVINTELFEVVSNVEVQGMPEGVVASTDNKSFYVFNKASGIVSKWNYLNSDDKQFLFMINNPNAMIIDQTETKLYVTSRTQNVLMIYNIKDKKYDSVVDIGSKPIDVDISDDGKTVYTLDAGDDKISAIDVATFKVINTINLMTGGFPSSLTIIPNENKALVTNAESDKITLVDLVDGSVVTMVPIGITSKYLVIVPAMN